MTEEIKFTEEELEKVATLQNKYQNSIFQLGELQIRKASLEGELEALKSVESNLKDEYLSIQKDETALLQSFTEKYGEGSLNIKTGTFTPAEKAQ
jgi:tmRNA-binding protein